MGSEAKEWHTANQERPPAQRLGSDSAERFRRIAAPVASVRRAMPNMNPSSLLSPTKLAILTIANHDYGQRSNENDLECAGQDNC